MRILSLALLAALLAPASLAQHRDHDDDDRHHDSYEKHQRSERGLVLGLGGSALVASGDFADDFGETTLGIRGFLGYQANSNLTVGIDLSGYELDEQEEFAETDSGLLLDITTTTSITRVAAFGRYGADLGNVTPFIEAHGGIDIVATTSRLGDTSSAEGIGQTQEESIVPALDRKSVV